MSAFDLRIAWMPRRVREAVELATTTEACGFGGLGLSDSPKLYRDVYPTIAACLERTTALQVGSNVVNPVSRHWSVHAASARAFDELFPGRHRIGLGRGDGAVASFGMRPASLEQLEASVRDIRNASPAATPIDVAASGPRSVQLAGRVADTLILGTGFDLAAIRDLSARARAARRDAGNEAPLGVQVQLPIRILDQPEDRREAEAVMRQLAIAYGRFAFGATYEGKHVPVALHQTMREGFARYSLDHHAEVGPANPNGRVFDDAPEVLAYLLERMVLLGTREDVRRRVEDLVVDPSVDGVNLVVIDDHPIATVRRAAEAFIDLLKPDLV